MTFTGLKKIIQTMPYDSMSLPVLAAIEGNTLYNIFLFLPSPFLPTVITIPTHTISFL